MHSRTGVEHGDHRRISSDQLRGAARRMVITRRALTDALPADLLHDPALDILLALYLGDEPVAAENLRFYTTVSAAVAGRWIKVLLSRELVDVVNDRFRLSDKGVSRMDQMLATAIALQSQP